MNAESPKTVYLADYQPFTHRVTAVHLTFRLAPKATRVLARLELQPNPARGQGHDLRLDGEGLRLIGARLNGAVLDVMPDDTGLTIAAHLLLVSLPSNPSSNLFSILIWRSFIGTLAHCCQKRAFISTDDSACSAPLIDLSKHERNHASQSVTSRSP